MPFSETQLYDIHQGTRGWGGEDADGKPDGSDWLVDYLKSLGWKCPVQKKVTDPKVIALKKKKEAFNKNLAQNVQFGEFDEKHAEWEKAKCDYGGAFCDDPVKLNGKIHYVHDFQEAVALADKNRCEAITKTKFGYKVCESAIPIKGQATKPEQAVMVWTKIETEFTYPYDRTEVVADRRIMSKRFALNMKAMIDFKLHGIVPTRAEPEKPKKKAAPKKAAKSEVPVVPAPAAAVEQLEQEPEPEDKCYDCKKSITFRRTIDNIDYCLGCAEKHEEPEPESEPESEPEPDLDVEEVWDTNGKMFYKDDDGKYYDIETSEEVEAFEEGEKPEPEPEPKKEEPKKEKKKKFQQKE